MIIGITGPSGAGKSTLAKKLNKTFVNSVYIDCDKIMHNPFLKNLHHEDYTKFLAKSKFLRPIVYLGANMSDELLDRYWPFELYSKIFSKTIRKIIAENKDKIIFIDSGFLTIMPEFFNLCDIKILVKADQDVRKERILKRKQNTKKELEKREASWCYLYDNAKFDIEIDTTNPLSPELKLQHLNLIQQIGKKRQEEKYCEMGL